MKRIFACLALAFAAASAHGQGVGINTTGAAADTSAVLDLTSTTKGFLPPRMTSAQRAAVVLPATGLVVYQTDGTTGLYVNVGTPAAPNWTAVSTGGGGGGQWSTSGANIYYNSGKVAVGTTPGSFRLAVQDTGSVLRVQANNGTGLLASLGGFGQVQVDAPGVAGGRLALLGNGNLGLGVANPTNKLSFASVGGKKISLYPVGTSDYGFGIAAGRLQVYTDGSAGGDVAIGTDNAGTFTEKFAFKNNGALAVGGNAGTAGQVLQSNGSGAAATWVNPQSASYANVYQTAIISSTPFPAGGGDTLVPGMSQTITVSGNAKAIVNYYVSLYNPLCTFCGNAVVYTGIALDGAVQHFGTWVVRNGEYHGASSAYMVNLSPGTHTISIVARATGSNVQLGSDPVTYGNSMTIQVIPQ